MTAAPYLLGRRGPGAAIVAGGGSGVTDGGFVADPVVTTTASGNTTVKGQVKPGSFGKFVYPLATIAAGRQYTFRYTPQFQQLAQQGKLAMVGFGLKNNNDFHIVGLRGDGSTGLHKYKVNGTPPNGWNKDTGHTTSDGGAAANGSQAGPNYIRLVVSADGATYKFQTSPDGSTWTDEYTAQTPTPFSNVSGVLTFGIALWFNNADAGPFSIVIDQFADVVAPAFILDGKSATGAWSASRDLLSSFAGGARYTTSTGVDSFKDQTGGGRHFENLGASSAQPGVTTAGPNSRTCLDFDGSNDQLINTSNLTDFIGLASGFIIASCFVDIIDTNLTGAGNANSNDCLWGDQGGRLGMEFLSGGPIVQGSNFVSFPWQITSVGISTGAALVTTWRHEGGNLYVSVNGGAEASVASGATASFAQKVCLGRATGGYMDGKIFEMATFSTVPTGTDRAAIIADFMTHIGAV